MNSITNLQMFSRSELANYDSDPAYVFIFVNRDELESLAEGILESGEYLTAVDDTEDWIRYHRIQLLEEGRVFVAIFQKSVLLMEGFIEPSIVATKSECAWDKKIDDGFGEIRCNKRVRVEPVGYCSLFQAKEKKANDMNWIL